MLYCANWVARGPYVLGYYMRLIMKYPRTICFAFYNTMFSKQNVYKLGNSRPAFDINMNYLV